MKKFVRFAFLLLPLLATTAHARESCSNPRLTPAFDDTESFYDNHSDISPYTTSDPRQHGQDSSSTQWLQRTAFLNLPELDFQDTSHERYLSPCNFDTALDAFDEIESSLGKNNPYLAFWAENQNRVLSGCTTNSLLPLAAIPDTAPYPARAASDLAYQKAAQLFYMGDARERASLETTFLALAHDASAPMQKRAAVMALRLAYINQGMGHAIDIAESLRKNPTTETAYAFAEDEIFSIYWMYQDDKDLTKALSEQKKRLQWLVDTALGRNTPRFSPDVDTQQNFKAVRRNDALFQLMKLITWGRLDGNNRHPNWWNDPEEQTEVHSESVRQLAQTEPYIDFLATHFMRTPLESWRWALYDNNNSFWKMSQELADHALDRFCTGEGVEWLNEAARLMPPQDPDIALTRDLLLRAIDDKPLHARQPFLRGELYHQAVRLSLLLKDDAAVTTLLGRHDINFVGRSGKRNYEEEKRDNEAFSSFIIKTEEQTLAWYAHQGQWDKVRAALDTIDTHIDPMLYLYGYGYERNPTNIYRFFTARTMDELLQSTRKISGSFGINLSFLFDQLPTATLLDLLERKEPQDLSGELSKELAPRVLVRSWLQGDAEQTQRALQLYTTRFPEKRLDALRASAGDSFDKALFMLRQQIGPIDNARLYSYTSLEKSNAVYNWSGPWCSITPDEYAAANDNVWEFAPNEATAASAYWWHNWDRYMSYYFRTADLSYDPNKFKDARRQAMAAHPLWQNANLAELQTLTREAGSPYLTTIINSYAASPTFWNKLMGRGDEIPEALHLAVRTARFGCHHMGDDYGKLSKKAFDILHKDYGESLWTKNTPYWYK